MIFLYLKVNNLMVFILSLTQKYINNYFLIFSNWQKIKNSS